jgi:diacylglycerol kinase (ATP)
VNDRRGARLVVNPGGGRGRTGRHLARLRGLAAARGLELELSTDVASLEAAGRRAAADGLDRLLVAGGDGTLHHALQGLARSGTALAILPLGSGNDLAAALGIPADLDAAFELALDGAPRAIDLGQVGGRFFAGVAGVGFDSEVNRYANRVRRLRGRAIYLWAVLRTLRGFRAPAMRIEHDGGGFVGRAMFVAVANSGRYGGGMRIAPGALLDDGRLDLVIVREMPRHVLLRVFPRVFRGGHTGHAAVEIVRTARVAVALDRPLTAYGDGEPLLAVGAEPVDFEVAPAALRVVAPA